MHAATVSQSIFTPQLVWKYGWQDGQKANTIGSGADPLPIPLNYLGSGGYAPSDISHAYGFDLIPIGGDGTGQTITIIDAYGSPTIQSDLDSFCTEFGIPSTTVNIIKPYGSPSSVNSTWALESTLDVQWAHAMAPGARINLIITPSNNYTMLSAISYATGAQGAKIISMSWGSTNEYNGIASDYSYYLNDLTTSYVASAGDHGFGVSWPAAASNVLSVGGTRLLYNSASNTVVSETGWSWTHDTQGWWATGGGISKYLTKPAFQKYWSGYTNRAVPDVSYNADGYTPVQVWFTDPVTGVSGWQQVGGTSAGAPQWAALIACRASLGNANPTPVNQQMYYLASNPTNTQYSNCFRDITSGNNGYSASIALDLMTGLGSPKANIIASSAPAASPTPGSTPLPSPAPVPRIPDPPILQQWGGPVGPIPADATNSGVKMISMGFYSGPGIGGPYDFSAVLTGQGRVVVWGANPCATVPEAASNGVTAISAGWSHMLAIKDGRVIAWGVNTSGATDVPMDATNGVIAISCGYHSSIALKADGTISAWGLKFTPTSFHNASSIIANINADALHRKVVGISDGYQQGMALMEDGTVMAFGNSFTTARDAQSDVPVGLNNVKSVSEGFNFALALKRNGTVIAWGNNNYGQCNVPAGLSGVVAISAGYRHALALRGDGTVIAWGSNGFGQTNIPSGLVGVKAVEAGYSYSVSSLQGVGDSQSSGGGTSSGNGGTRNGNGRLLPSPRSAPVSRGGVAGTGGAGAASGAGATTGRSVPVPRAAPAGR